MSLIWKAIRAVTMEAMGIAAVVWVLFAGVGWTVQSSSNDRSPIQPKVEAERAMQWLQESTGEVVEALKPPIESRERGRYVEQRLDHYSQRYREDAGAYIKQAARDLADQIRHDNSRKEDESSRQLFGSL